MKRKIRIRSDSMIINGAPRNPYVELLGVKYNYKKDISKCGRCGGIGVPWGGWFSCEDCYSIALVNDGRTFIPHRG